VKNIEGVIMVLRIALILFVLFMVSACGDSKRVAYPVKSVASVPHVSPRLDTRTQVNYLAAVNRMRAKTRKCGNTVYKAAKPLRWNTALYKASYEHSNDMAVCSYFSHKGSGKQSDWTAQKQKLGQCSSFVNRIENNGYIRHRGISENIAYGANSIETVMQQWIGSKDHCKNIMNPLYTEVGMAEVVSENGIHYWTQNFGAKLP